MLVALLVDHNGRKLCHPSQIKADTHTSRFHAEHERINA
jgi:hypothetical protein